MYRRTFFAELAPLW